MILTKIKSFTVLHHSVHHSVLHKYQENTIFNSIFLIFVVFCINHCEKTQKIVYGSKLTDLEYTCNKQLWQTNRLIFVINQGYKQHLTLMTPSFKFWLKRVQSRPHSGNLVDFILSNNSSLPVISRVSREGYQISRWVSTLTHTRKWSSDDADWDNDQVTDDLILESFCDQSQQLKSV